MKKLLFISLAAILALSVGLVGCSSAAQYTLTIASSSGGSVFPAVGEHTYNAGQVVDIKATPASDAYQFVNWTGDTDDIADPNAAATKITMNGDYSIKANFESLPWDSTIELKMHCTVASTASICKYVYIPWADKVNNLTGTQGGKFKITMTFGDIPFKPEQSLTQIAGGVVDIGQLSADTYNLGSLAYMPWMFPDVGSVAYTMYNILTEGNGKWDALGELQDVKILLSTPLHGSQWWSWLHGGDVRVPADIAGPPKLKVRVESGFAESAIVQALGGSPTYIGTSDLTTSLSAGTVEGCFMTYTGIRPPFNFCNATASVTELNMFYRPYALAMNKASFDKLPAEAQTALMSLCGAQASVDYALAHIASEGGPFGYKTVTNQCHPIIYPTPAELQQWKDATAGVSTNWVTYMSKAGFDGAGILARAQALIPQTPK